MMRIGHVVVMWVILIVLSAPGSTGDEVSGELKKWHKVTLTFDGPNTGERADPNPFLEYRLDVLFKHPQSGKSYRVPGYYAADGDAGQTGADTGDQWRVHFASDEEGAWTYTVSFRQGPFVAVSNKPDAGKSGGFMDGKTGSFTIEPTDKEGRDFRSKGRLQFVGKRYLWFAETGEYFLKCGADAPENFLAYSEFDGTFHADGHNDHLVKTWEPHIKDWRPGDPTWRDGKGKGIIGALNYLSSKDMNAVSFLTLNIKGDDRNVYPYIDYDTHDRFDVSKLDQWEVVLEHADRLGLFLHFKTQEAENQGLLDNGDLGIKRKLYYRHLIARFGHHLALNWNMGEEVGGWMKNNPTPSQNTQQRLAMARYFHEQDPYQHHRVIHNGIPFDDLLVPESRYTGISMQYSVWQGHKWTLHWLDKAARSGITWVVCHDEQNPADHGVLTDKETSDDHRAPRTGTLWGTLLGGGMGCEYYFGYKHPHSDLTCQDWRSRDRLWDLSRYALALFKDNEIPFWDMTCRDELTKGEKEYCLCRPGDHYVIYLPEGGTTELDLETNTGAFRVLWYNPRAGGDLQPGSIAAINGPGKQGVGFPPAEPEQDWVVLVRR